MGLKPGDVVVLKSGSPFMTIQQIYDDGDAQCQWFDDKKQLQSGMFPLASLKEPGA